jgi:hypothetical protein
MRWSRSTAGCDMSGAKPAIRREDPRAAALLEALEVGASQFELGEVPRNTRDIHWMRPRLVADVEMAELTAREAALGEFQEPAGG